MISILMNIGVLMSVVDCGEGLFVANVELMDGENEL
jgi:hypothetical protein